MFFIKKKSFGLTLFMLISLHTTTNAIFIPILYLLELQHAFDKTVAKAFGTKSDKRDPLFNVGGINENKEKKEDKTQPDVKFSEIIGIDPVIEDVREIVEYIKNPARYKALGAKPYKGILLEGPPGSGKTMIAKAIATEANCNIEYASASSFVEMYVGVGAKRVRELFDKARKSKPTIIFIDELDAIGAINRGAGGNEEYRQTLNELLCQMDGFTGDEGIIVLAATNNAKALDSALKRAGRFDRIINVPLPNLAARIKLVQTAHQKLPSCSISNEYMEQLAKDTYGLTAADLNNIFNEAALLAVRENATEVDEKHMATAAKKIISERRK